MFSYEIIQIMEKKNEKNDIQFWYNACVNLRTID